MELSEIIRARRSIRLFGERPVPYAMLLELADLARYYPSAGNRQPIRCAIVSSPALTDAVFSCLNWAMYLPEFSVPPNRRPKAYLLLYGPHTGCSFDAGAAAQTVLLAAQAMGLASCCLQPARPGELPAPLREAAGELTPLVALALGYAANESTVVPFQGDLRYFEGQAHHFYVPKYPLEDTLIFRDLPPSD